MPDDGNVLIIIEDNDPTDPDDALHGGVFRFDLSGAVDLTSVVIIDTEEGGQTSAFDENGDLVGLLVPISKVLDGVVQTIDLSAFDGVRKLEVALNGSGAMDDLKLEYCRPDPECDCFVL